MIIDDALGLCESLERDMDALVATYQCEWREVVENPERHDHFRHFANDEANDPEIKFIDERGQKRPADWDANSEPVLEPAPTPSEDLWSWVGVGLASHVPADSGRAFKVGEEQLAVFRLADGENYYATENRCPHKKDMVLARGMLGSEAGEPKVACPLHKKTFSLASGKGLSDPNFCVKTYPVEVRGEDLFIKLPPSFFEAAPVGQGQ